MQKTMLPADEIYMQRALELAANGAGYTQPNPLVGCVIVHKDKIIGEGWHQKFGSPHAEVNAINSVVNKNLLPESTVYVTLEPCSHFGKTPPCADLLVKHNVKKIIICNLDPNPKVAGKGIAKLRAADIEVISGFLAEKGSVLNRRFFNFHQLKIPYIILKWAQSSDGFIAKENYEPANISSATAKNLVHKWRSEEGSILVGTRTAKYDNPKLTTREWSGPNPIRLVIDKNLTLPPNLHLFDKSQQTLVFNLLQNFKVHKNLEFIKLETERNFLSQILYCLYQREIQSVFIEGGTFLLESILRANIWNEARIIRSSQKLFRGIAAPQISNNTLIETSFINEDQLFIHHNINQEADFNLGKSCI